MIYLKNDSRSLASSWETPDLPLNVFLVKNPLFRARFWLIRCCDMQISCQNLAKASVQLDDHRNIFRITARL